ncbi:MAG: hypothetical protein DSZ05_03380 [Sulfurospirillum sp.]|nr:MAG: hypothetical protein DSZ05_03380 [Sulfurospirillum sp.]
MKLIAFFVLLFSLFMIHEHYQLHQKQKLDVLQHIDPLPETLRLIDEDKYAEASEYLGFFMKYDYIKENPKAQKLYDALEQKRNSMAYQSEKAVEGVLKGKSDETIGQISAGISDFFLLGDLRDLSIEGYHYLKGEHVDKVLVGLSTIGVVVTGATMLSAGSTAGVKGGVSALKLMRKSKKMPLWLEKFIIRSAKEVKISKNIKSVRTLLEDVYDVTKNSGFSTTMKLLNKAPNMKAFRNSIGFAKTFGKESGALVKILGDDAPVYYRLLKDKTSKKAFLKAATYGEPGIKRLAKMGEKGFLKSIKPVVKTSRLAKVFNKNIVRALYKIPVAVYIFTAMVSLVLLT